MNTRLEDLQVLASASRRRFLGRSIAWSAAAATPFALDLQNIAHAADVSGYKALVCVFLFGGNDNANTVVPYDLAEFNDYVAARANTTLALTRAELSPISAASLGARQLGLPLEMSALRSLYLQNKVAILGNVGVLADPLTPDDYKNRATGSKRIPPQLFSHSDHQTFWQSGLPQYNVTTGWAGRMADRIAASGAAGNGKVSFSMSLAGNNLMQAGDSVLQYQLGTSGALAINALKGSNANNAQGKALDALLKQSQTHLMANEYKNVVQRSRDAEASVQAALAAIGDAASPGTPANAIKTLFDPLVRPANGAANRLASQLEMAAKMIAARNTLGHARQVFFVSLGGFDTHDTLDESHGSLLKAFSDAVATFYAATKVLAVENDVVTFSASDFGRTLQTNGRGSDHGWGAHHFVIGGAVKGGNVYGNWNGIQQGGNLLAPFPTIKIGAPEDVGQGRLLPTTSVDQYAAVLAKWFGVADSELAQVLPNIGRYNMPGLAQRFV